VTSGPEPLPTEPPSDPWALPSTPHTGSTPITTDIEPPPTAPHPRSTPITPYLSLPDQHGAEPGDPQSGQPLSSQPLSRPSLAGASLSDPPLSGPALSEPPLSGPSSDPFAVVAQHGPVIVQIGEIAVTSTLVRTPAGDIPLSGSTWHVADYWHNEQKTPTWAIVMAVVGFCVLTFFSLLFLLAKETVYRGTAQITVTNGTRQYVARIPITDQAQLAHLHQQVNYVRSLAAL
jgi:hypothetical protein